jgi:hypothetical protein
VIDRTTYSAALEIGIPFLAFGLGIPTDAVQIDPPRLFALAEQVEAADGWLELRAVLPDIEIVLSVIHVRPELAPA